MQDSDAPNSTPTDATSESATALAPVSTTPEGHQRLKIGMEFDGYRLEEKLHVGGMAALWRVTDLRQRPQKTHHAEKPSTTLLPLIMKVPLLFTSDDPTAIVAFEVEQMIMPKLKGQHVPQYIASGDFEAQPYIVMEQIAGTSLRTRFDAAPLPIDEVVQIGIKVAQALQDLHRQHVIHLDLKPSNIMFRPNGDAVLIDFGLSRHDKLPDLLAEEFRLPLGTGPYISPEQVLGVRNEPHSDQFALGVLLYHLATGERPFGNPSGVAGLRKRLYRDPIPPRKHNAAIPPWLQEVILRCLEVDPAARFESAAQLAFALQDPSQINLTARASKTAQDGTMAVLKRRFQAAGAEPFSQQSVAEQLSRAPIIVAALDLSNSSATLTEQLRQEVRRLLFTEPGARLACITVRKTSRFGLDESLLRDGQNIHVKQLVELKHWARPLQLKGEKISFHVLEAPDAANAVIDFAHKNGVDHIVIGSRGSSSIRRYLGSVSAQVVALAECTVTVVKASAT